MCADGPCTDSMRVYSDGNWEYESQSPDAARMGQLTRAELEEWENAVATTRLAEMPEQTELCPKDYDGQEIIYGWETGGSEHVISNCERHIDERDPLVVAFRQLREQLR